MAARVSEPRIRVAAVILVGDRLVLVRQAKGAAPYHLLPGGGVERGETLEHALMREVAEETGLDVAIVRPLFISDTLAPDGSRHVVNLTFLCRPIGTPRAPTSEPAVIGVDYVSRKQVGALDLRPPMAQALADAWDVRFEGPCRYLGALWVDESESDDA